jgi:hypothetical protein
MPSFQRFLKFDTTPIVKNVNKKNRTLNVFVPDAALFAADWIFFS